MRACSDMWWHQQNYLSSTTVFAVIYPHRWVGVYADYILSTAYRQSKDTSIVEKLNYYLMNVSALAYLRPRLFWWPAAFAVHLLSDSSIPHRQSLQLLLWRWSKSYALTMHHFIYSAGCLLTSILATWSLAPLMEHKNHFTCTDTWNQSLLLSMHVLHAINLPCLGWVFWWSYDQFLVLFASSISVLDILELLI